jgi:hypothetical protein
MRDRGLAGIGETDVGDRDGRAGFADERAAVGRLAAGGRIEHGAVEHDAAVRLDGDDRRAAILQIRVLAEQAVGGHGKS